MNTSIIPITESETGIQTVNARELHTFLEVGKDFSTWIKDRISQFGFEEGIDYSPESGNRSDGLPGKPRLEYHLSLDMAKEVSMLEKTPKGKFARQYFIECEKRLRLGLSYPAAGSQSQDLTARVEKLEQERTFIPEAAEDYFSILRAQLDLGVPAATAARNAIRLAPPRKQKTGILRHQDLNGFETVLDLPRRSSIQPADSLVNRMVDDKFYSTDELIQMLPRDHAIFRCSKGRGQRSAMGRLMMEYVKSGRIRRQLSTAHRMEFMRIPVIIQFSAGR